MGGMPTIKQMTDDMKAILESNITYLATVSKDSKPNVVPMGLVEPISDSEILIVDVLFNKTRKNLEENAQVALAVTDVNRLQAYQFKGKAKIAKSGDLFNRAFQIMEKKATRRNKIMEEKFAKSQDPELKKRFNKLNAMHTKLKPKAVVLITIDEIYHTM